MENWSNFYTPKTIANEIVSMLPKEFNPVVAIDICVGSGNFLNAAANNWSDIKLVGADIDTSLVDRKLQGKYQLYQLNALKIDKLRDAISANTSNKLLLANPPFGNIDKNFDQCNGNLHIELSNEARKLNRIEALMLVSNLSLMTEGDYFGAIIPENFFTSDKFLKFRTIFLSFFEEIKIGNTKKYFANSDVRTRTFIGRYKFENDTNEIQKKIKRVENINLKLNRGIDNSKLTASTADTMKEVLHFSNKRGEILTPKFTHIDNCRKELLVKTNNTLILRVGRHSGLVFNAKKTYLNKYISDYFYLLKDIKLSLIERNALKDQLLEETKGLTTKYITKVQIERAINLIVSKRN
jgi:hypothetical protein